ncbi:hypothetical protein BpHYR1_028232, partial [Brachionus plicatilis]
MGLNLTNLVTKKCEKRDTICDVRYLGIIEVSSQSEHHEFFAVPGSYCGCLIFIFSLKNVLFKILIQKNIFKSRILTFQYTLILECICAHSQRLELDECKVTIRRGGEGIGLLHNSPSSLESLRDPMPASVDQWPNPCRLPGSPHLLVLPRLRSPRTLQTPLRLRVDSSRS